MTVYRERLWAAPWLFVATALVIPASIIVFAPINMIAGSVAERSAFFQLYLACTVLTVLPIAAELRHRKLLFQRLQESEARHKLITETATDMLVTFDVDGVISYVSPSIREIAGYEPESVIGHLAREFVDAKRREWIAYARHVSDWEMRRYGELF